MSYRKALASEIGVTPKKISEWIHKNYFYNVLADMRGNEYHFDGRDKFIAVLLTKLEKDKTLKKLEANKKVIRFIQDAVLEEEARRLKDCEQNKEKFHYGYGIWDL